MADVDYALFRRGGVGTLRDLDGGRPPAGREAIVSLPDGGTIALYDTVRTSGFPSFDVEPGTDRVYLQAHGPDGAALSGQVDVPVDEDGYARNPQVAVVPGGIVVAWEVRADETGGTDTVRVRRFTSELEPVGEVASPFAGVLENPRFPQLVVDPATGEAIVIAREDAGNGDVAYARLDAALSVTARGTADYPWDGEPIGAAVGADAQLVLMSETDEGMTLWPSGATLADQGVRTYDAQLDALPNGGFVASFIDVNDDGYENARVTFVGADGQPVDDGVLLATSDPSQLYQIPDHATRDVNVDVLPSGHVVVTHLASFTLTSGDLPVVNVFAPDGERLLRDLVIDDVGTYFEVMTDVADGALTVAYYDGDAREVLTQTIDLVRRTVTDDGGERVEGDALADDVFGGAGNDTVFAHGGDDVVRAGAGDDAVEGGWGEDVLVGEDGADLLVGGAGDDVLYGDDVVG